MKLNKNSIRFKIPFYLFTFVIIMLLLLWILEVLLLDTIYKTTKTNSIIKTGNYIEENINHPNIHDYVDELALKSDVCVLVFDDNMNIVLQSDASRKCSKDVLNQNRLIERIYNASKSNNTYIEEVRVMETKPNLLFPFFNNESQRTYNEIQYTHIINNRNPYYLLMNTTITPLDATVDTLKTILFIVTLLMGTIAIIMGTLISRKITIPIQKINNSAKDLGKENVVFEGKGYLEIEELSETLNQANKDLHQVEKLRNELISNISHDLKTPLTMISGYAEMMRDLPDENNEENLNIIIEETKYLTRLVNDVLDLSKLQAGATKLDIKEFDCTQLIINIIERVKSLSNLEIIFEYQENIMIQADELKISQVFYNILNNALHYTKDKVIIKQIILDNTIRIEIIDNGEGIHEDELDSIWQCYYRSNNHKRQVSGSGLGLYICKQILDLHHANYGVTSKIYECSCFWFDLDKVRHSTK